MYVKTSHSQTKTSCLTSGHDSTVDAGIAVDENTGIAHATALHVKPCRRALTPCSSLCSIESLVRPAAERDFGSFENAPCRTAAFVQITADRPRAGTKPQKMWDMTVHLEHARHTSACDVADAHKNSASTCTQKDILPRD